MARASFKGLKALSARLLSEDENVRYEAARDIAWQIRPPVEDVLRWTEDTRPRLREMACFILGCKGYIDASRQTTAILYPEAVPTLVGLLDDLDEDVRLSAIAALGSHAVASTLPNLLGLAFNSSAQVRLGVAQALSGFAEWDRESLRYKTETEATLLRLMDDSDDDVRDWATFAVYNGGHDSPAVRSRLWKALDDPNPDVRGEAAEGLATFGDRSLVPRLEQLLREDKELSPCYFLAAQVLGDPVLLPAVLVAAQHWHDEGHENNWFVEPTIEALREKSNGDSDAATMDAGK